jgi:beta-phosphoglucomutase family hydrolase
MEAVIFDLDELLVDNAQNHLDASLNVFKKYGMVFDGNINPYVGMRISDFLKDMMKRNGVHLKYYPEIYRKRQELFIKLVKNNCAPMPGMKYVLGLVKEEGYKMAVASSGSKKYIQLCLKMLKIANYFDVVVSGEDLKNGKPHPETFLVAAKKLNVDPKNCVVLEDAMHGVLAAKKAGMKVIGVHDVLHRRAQDLSDADFEVFSLNELEREHFIELLNFSLLVT